MRFGVCIDTNSQALLKLKKYGYDYAEANLSALANLSDKDFAAFAKAVEQSGLQVESCNGFFFNYDLGYLTSDKVDFSELEKYIRKALERATSLGLKVAVIGSGRARHILDESNREAAEERFAQVLRLAGDVADKYDVQIVIEPLNRKETNLVNTVADGLALCERVDHPRVSVLADFFHVSMSGESLDAIRTCGDKLRHVHIARNNPDRQMPINPEDEADCIRWAAALKENGYNARISLEGGYGKDWDDTMKKMRQVLTHFE